MDFIMTSIFKKQCNKLSSDKIASCAIIDRYVIFTNFKASSVFYYFISFLFDKYLFQPVLIYILTDKYDI